jgi:hypothetical protein
MDTEDLRLAVYRAFAGTGRAPEPGELAGQLGADVQEVAVLAPATEVRAPVPFRLVLTRPASASS